jgi:sulfite exporter TauE/SafE
MAERRKTDLDSEKFSTQRTVTYCLLGIFAGVVSAVLWQSDQSERSMILQTVINLTLLAVGYWLGASKQGQEQAQSMSRIAEAAPSVAAAVVANAKSDAQGLPNEEKPDETIRQ